MDHIGGRLADLARNIEIVGADPITRHGFTQVPNFILTKTDISVGAKLAYAMLLKYAWGEQAFLRGQAPLAKEMGGGKPPVPPYQKEFEPTIFWETTHRGLEKTTLSLFHLPIQKQKKPRHS